MDKILKEITSVLFEKEVILKANQQFQAKNKIIPVNNIQNMDFRLFLSDAGTINLEVLVRNNYALYFKPVGYYEFKANIISNIYVLKEFEEAYNNIKDDIDDNLNNKVKFLDIESNSYIAVCSMDVLNIAKGILNGSIPSPSQIISNGIEIYIFSYPTGMFMGTVEARVEDENYELSEDIFVFYTNNEVKCIDSLYHSLREKGLLSALKRD